MRRPLASRTGGAQLQAGPLISGNDILEHFYSYTSGRFLFDEDMQLKERYKRFSVPELMDVSAKAVSASKCNSIIKLTEGTYNKIFLLTMNNGKQVVARIPNPYAGSAHYTTASEVATMHFLRTRLNMPVPRVFAYSSDSRNPVGSEYIIMEKVDGVDLSSCWDSFNIETKRNIVRSLAEIQSRLFDAKFSSFGCLYFRGDIPKYCAQRLYDIDHTDDATYCIGMSTAHEFWDPQRVTGADPGPCKL
jgi:hypothetical protein